MPPPLRPMAADIEGDGPAVILLHGQPGQAGSWSHVVEGLAGRYRAVAPDRLGYGRTGGPAGDFAANAAATVSLMDRHGIDRAIVVGHSWGGPVAMQVAVDTPERVAGLVLVSSVAPGEPIGTIDRLLATPVLGDLASLATVGVAARALALPALRRAVARALPAGPRELVALSRPNLTAWRSFAVEQRVYVRDLASLAGLEGIVAPTAIVVGLADRIVAPDAATALAAAIPGSWVRAVPGAGHLLPWDHPHAVVAAIDEVHAATHPGR